MNRLAGTRLQAASGRSDLTGADMVTALAALGGLGGITVSGLMGLIDLFQGSSRADNSGEYLANSAITAIPWGTAAAGAGLVAATDPVARGLLNVMGEVAAARQAGQEYGADAVMRSMAPDAAMPNRQAVEEAANRVQQAGQAMASRLQERLQAKPGLTPEMAVLRSGHNLARGASLGALAGSVPAVMLMMDSPAGKDERNR